MAKHNNRHQKGAPLTGAASLRSANWLRPPLTAPLCAHTQHCAPKPAKGNPHAYLALCKGQKGCSQQAHPLCWKQLLVSIAGAACPFEGGSYI